MNWTDYTTALYNMLQVADPSGQAKFNLILPRLIDDAELRIFRDSDLDFLVTRTTDATQTTATGSRNVPIPEQFIVVEDVGLFVPAGTTSASGTRIPMLRADRSFIDLIWPNASLTRTPTNYGMYWAIFNFESQASNTSGISSSGSSIVIAPTPDGQYTAEFQGTFRPESFYALAGFNSTTGVAVNPVATTFLSTYLPDLLFAATMVISYAYLKNWSAASDDPHSAMSWETHFQQLKSSAAIEEARKASKGYQWSSYGIPFAVQAAAPPPAPAVR